MPPEASRPDPPRFLTALQAARELQLSQSAIYALCESGEIRCLRVGLHRGRIRIAREDLDAYLESCQQAVPLKLEAPRRRRAAVLVPMESALKARGYTRSKVSS